MHSRLTDIYTWAVAAAVTGSLAAGALRPLARLLTGPGWAPAGAPGRLFAVAAVLLLLGGLAQLLRAAGPVAAGPAFRFWLLATPVRRRELLQRRFAVLIAGAVALACVVAAPIAHAASVPAAPTIAASALAAVTVTAAAVLGQASTSADRLMHAFGRSAGILSVAGFGSLATGAGRVAANSALAVPPVVGVMLLAALAVAALACAWRAYRALDRIGISVLGRGHGLWASGQAAALSLDAFMLADAVSERRARAAGPVRPVTMSPNFAVALLRSQWASTRRRPYLAVRGLAAAAVWWGCRAVLPGPVLAAMAVVAGYCLVLPLAGTMRQLALGPGLRAQFAPRDRWLGLASAGVCLLAAACWAAIIVPGLAGPGRAVPAVAIAAGVTAAVCRTMSRPPLDYSKPPVPTPFGDVPLDLWRQLVRGPLLLAVLTVAVALVG